MVRERRPAALTCTGQIAMATVRHGRGRAATGEEREDVSRQAAEIHQDPAGEQLISQVIGWLNGAVSLTGCTIPIVAGLPLAPVPVAPIFQPAGGRRRSASGPLLTFSSPDVPNPAEPAAPRPPVGKLTVELVVSTATIDLRQILVLGAEHLTATLEVVETGVDDTFNIMGMSVETTATNEQPGYGDVMTISCDFQTMERVAT
jgi:hypothetical protein